ncbi:MAG TPA: hypothetical protein VGQ71_15570 [Terriglobales bacterium]|jgi:hypothetical protein|nr:hypothetical protein [Terriglobales bacterium]
MSAGLEKVDDLQQRQQVDGTFTARLAALLCRKGLITRDEVDGIFSGLKAPAAPDASDTVKRLAAVGGFEAARLAHVFEESL